jgi:hypothetical protein
MTAEFRALSDQIRPLFIALSEFAAQGGLRPRNRFYLDNFPIYYSIGG